MSSEDAKKCIVGIFDVLGYQSFLENNSATDTAQKVLTLINGLNQRVENVIKAKTTFSGVFASYVPQMKWLVFSDTVLLVNEYPDTETLNEVATAWSYLLMSSVILERIMFNDGLPIRGAVGFGKVLVNQNCFAGRPIVEAYQLSTDLDLAGAALTERAKKEFERVQKEMKEQKKTGDIQARVKRLLETMTIKYCAPRKKGTEARLVMLNFASIKFSLLPDLSDDTRQKVLESFMKHNKDLPSSAKSKLDNTELFLRHCITRTDD